MLPVQQTCQKQSEGYGCMYLVCCVMVAIFSNLHTTLLVAFLLYYLYYSYCSQYDRTGL